MGTLLGEKSGTNSARMTGRNQLCLPSEPQSHLGMNHNNTKAILSLSLPTLWNTAASSTVPIGCCAPEGSNHTEITENSALGAVKSGGPGSHSKSANFLKA